MGIKALFTTATKSIHLHLSGDDNNMKGSDKITSSAKRGALDIIKDTILHRPGRSIASDRTPKSTTTAPDPTQSKADYRFKSPQPKIKNEAEPPKSGLLHKPLAQDDTVGCETATDGDQLDQVKTVILDLRAAEKVLEQRHAALNSIPQPNSGKKIVKKNTVQPIARLPVHLSPSYDRKQLHATEDGRHAVQRRQLIMHMVLDAVAGCPTAIHTMERVNAHFASTTTSDLILDFRGVHVRLKDIGVVENNWISRYNVVDNSITLVARRILSAEDSEVIYTQLFPEERGHLLKPEHFEIFMTGLGEEGTYTKEQAKAIARLGVTVEEFEKGPRFKGHSKSSHDHKHDPAALLIFDIPKDMNNVGTSLTPCPIKAQSNALYSCLRILVEAAVYNQKYWKGYFFANARSKLNDFYQAYKLSQEGQLLPPHLADYKRNWTYRETRLLQRGKLVCEILALYESGELTDFGIIRISRGTLVHIPAQPFLGLDDLESFLYHRITDSGLPVSKIPEILALHSENDTAFSNARLRGRIMKNLADRAIEFEDEEELRLKEIKTSHTTFESVLRAQRSPWERMKARLQKLCGKKKEVVPFDPFAPEHETADDKHGAGQN